MILFTSKKTFKRLINVYVKKKHSLKIKEKYFLHTELRILIITIIEFKLTLFQKKIFKFIFKVEDK